MINNQHKIKVLQPIYLLHSLSKLTFFSHFSVSESAVLSFFVLQQHVVSNMLNVFLYYNPTWLNGVIRQCFCTFFTI